MNRDDLPKVGKPAPPYFAKIRRRMDVLGLKQADLVRLTGYTQQRINLWLTRETGEMPPRVILRFARVLDVPVEYLCDDAISDPSQVFRPTDDERALLAIFRESGLSLVAAIDAIYRARSGGEKSAIPVEGLPPQYARPVGHREIKPSPGSEPQPDRKDEVADGGTLPRRIK